MSIHPTAVIAPTAELAEDVTVGPFAIVEEDVVIGTGTVIESHAVIHSGTRLGAQCRVYHGASVGGRPQDLKYAEEQTYLEVGDRTQIREFATLHRGTTDAVTTRIGSDCLLMAYVHVAHDCQIGDHVILSNAVNLAGHCRIEDWVIIGGMVPVHQFVHIGQHAFIGGGVRVTRDVPPFILAAGEPLKYTGLNRVGLERRGFSTERREVIKNCYRKIYSASLNVSQAVQAVQDQFGGDEDARLILDFIQHAERGIIP
ncbi:MAG: acyl-ACP--UDP-N-acetylglucosamine O-acyltransferase [Candidatus Delongbacteria bacterium]|nr:acyl-ACP--UDP-N-acetylglucosamine O-acyltransferase [Candidatus Delongbacteria bacterium]